MSGDCPIALYKFKDISGDGIQHVEDMFRNHRVWFPSPLAFNDPFDCRVVFDSRNTREEIVFRKAAFLVKHEGLSLEEALSKADNEIPRGDDEVEKWQLQQFNGHSIRAANTGIFCLTSACDDFLMWTHYAKNHTGICVQYRVSSPEAEAQMDFIAAAQQVEYADRCPLINTVRDSSAEIVRKAYLTKAIPFRHEREWRIVKYDQGAGLKSIPAGVIGTVILGCQIERTAATRVIEICRAYDGRVQIVRSKLDPQTYGLTFERESIV